VRYSGAGPSQRVESLKHGGSCPLAQFLKFEARQAASRTIEIVESERGHPELPDLVLEQLGLRTGDELLIEVRDGGEIVMRRPHSVFDLKLPHSRRDTGLSDRETTDAAWDEHIRDSRGLGRSDL
jgi:bifunctional DNA-binding transcriptional regulator/antitoxin component of YhaV-PrlF toxin-antitoxin module